MELFKKGDKIGKYTVNEFIKKGASAGMEELVEKLKV